MLTSLRSPLQSYPIFEPWWFHYFLTNIRLQSLTFLSTSPCRSRLFPPPQHIMQFTSLVALLAGASAVSAHGVILAAEGDKGKSQGFLVNENVARNCTEISPCQQDSVIIRDAEIQQNIVNGCGRTELNGNIDIGEQTENELAANRMTQVSQGSSVAVTIHQVNADGAGPYECDLDDTSKWRFLKKIRPFINSHQAIGNSGTNFQKLQISNNVPGENGLSDAKFQDFTINVQMPDNLNCTGGKFLPVHLLGL